MAVSYQVLHMVFLFSAAKMIPLLRPTALSLQRTLYRHKRDDEKAILG